MSTAGETDPFWMGVRELFFACVDLSPDQRRALLERECSDPRLRAETESLLAEHDGADGFLDASVWELSAARELPVETRIGPYQLVRSIGSGGMGTVFLGERTDEQVTQRVAVKLVRADAAGVAILRRFRQERQILAVLEHPNIARLIDCGSTAAGMPYLVMDYVEGIPIDAYCRDHALPIDARLRLFLQLCEAVQYAHRNLVIHRDIKPANVLVTSEGVPKLLDFGIAKLTSDTVARPDATVTRLMTPDYASPEQLLGQLVTTATDVYSLGLLLFELLTGAKPFAGQLRNALTEVPRPSSAGGGRALRGDLDRILLVALDRDPNRRYGSVEKLADDLRRHLSGHPITARGATLGYRTAKFVRRNKLAVAAAAIALIVGAVAFYATLRQKQVAERRFDQVRSLAHSVVFELHDAIATLPGSTPARALLVRRALVYLDALAADAANNSSLQTELAGAYERIGDVQGLPYRPNLGDGAAALLSYRKALTIAGEVRASEPANRAVLTLIADLHDRAGLIEQRALRFPEALTDHQTARTIREQLPNRGPAGDLALARTWVALGDTLYLSTNVHPVHDGTVTPQGAYEAALRILGGLQAEGPGRSELLAETARAHQRLGAFLTRGTARDPAAALAHHQAALRALQERAALHPTDALARRDAADQLVMTATLQNTTGDSAAALEGTTRAMAVLGELAAADPNNIEAQHDLAFVHEQQASAYYQLARFDQATRSVREALRIRERLARSDRNNLEDRRGLVGLYALLADLEEQRGHHLEARAAKAEGMRIFHETRGR
ncbi:MAG: ppkA [Acidobacteria bacterium]|nr:ppkA [Acidobacteriota bacterium]